MKPFLLLLLLLSGNNLFTVCLRGGVWACLWGARFKLQISFPSVINAKICSRPEPKKKEPLHKGNMIGIRAVFENSDYLLFLCFSGANNDYAWKEIWEMRELCLKSCSSHSVVHSHFTACSVVPDWVLTRNADNFSPPSTSSAFAKTKDQKKK